MWFVPLVFRVPITSTGAWHVGLKWALWAMSVLGSVRMAEVFVRISSYGNVLLSIIVRRFGTEVWGRPLKLACLKSGRRRVNGF